MGPLQQVLELSPLDSNKKTVERIQLQVYQGDLIPGQGLPLTMSLQEKMIHNRN